jgi:hypothetical protein
MSTKASTSGLGSTARVVKLVIGCIAFGILMAVRHGLESPEARALVASVAGGVLGVCVLRRTR